MMLSPSQLPGNHPANPPGLIESLKRVWKTHSKKRESMEPSLIMMLTRITTITKKESNQSQWLRRPLPLPHPNKSISQLPCLSLRRPPRKPEVTLTKTLSELPNQRLFLLPRERFLWLTSSRSLRPRSAHLLRVSCRQCKKWLTPRNSWSSPMSSSMLSVTTTPTERLTSRDLNSMLLTGANNEEQNFLIDSEWDFALIIRSLFINLTRTNIIF